MPRPLHPVEEPAIVAAGEAMQRERRPEKVTAEPRESVPIIGVDPDAGVEGEAIDEGAASDLLERLGIPQAAVHLGGLQGGEGVGLRLDVVVEADQDLSCSASRSNGDRAARGC